MNTTTTKARPQLEPHIGCIAAAMEIIGNKWTALLLRDLAAGPQRFGQLEKSLRRGHTAGNSAGRSGSAPAAISPRTLSQRLDDLQSHGIITRTVYAEVPPRCEYALTAKGQDLLPILKQMALWGDKYS